MAKDYVQPVTGNADIQTWSVFCELARRTTRTPRRDFQTIIEIYQVESREEAERRFMEEYEVRTNPRFQLRQ